MFRLSDENKKMKTNPEIALNSLELVIPSLENISEWTEVNKTYELALTQYKKLSKKLEDAHESGNEKEIESTMNLLEVAEKQLWNTYETLSYVAEPTELTLTVAKEQVQQDLEDIKSTMNETELDIVSNLNISNMEKDESGKWIVDIDAYSNLDEYSQAKVQQYIDYLAEEHEINVLQGEGAVTTLEVLQGIKTILENTYTLMVEAEDATSAAEYFKGIWDGIKDKTVTLTQGVVSWFKNLTGSNNGDTELNGTAHASGTAYSSGSWGAKSTETALVGELGPELV